MQCKTMYCMQVHADCVHHGAHFSPANISPLFVCMFGALLCSSHDPQVAEEEVGVKKRGVKVSAQEAKSIFLFCFFSPLHFFPSYFRPRGDNEGFGFVNIISGILQPSSSCYLWPEF